METLTSVRMNCHALLDKPRIYADLNGGWRVDDKYIVPLNSSATTGDLRSLGYTLTPGLTADFWTDDGDYEGNPYPLLFQGVVQFYEETQLWVAVADWNRFHHASETGKPDVQEVITINPDLFDSVVEYTEIPTGHSARAQTVSKQPIKI